MDIWQFFSRHTVYWCATGYSSIDVKVESFVLLCRIDTLCWQMCGIKYWRHRHLREIDCSSAVVGGPAAGAESGGKSIHWTRMWCQKVLHSGCCGWQHNYYSQQRQAGRANEQSTSLRCLWLKVSPSMQRSLFFPFVLLSLSHREESHSKDSLVNY